MAEYINREELLATVNGVWERIYDRCTYQPVHDVYRMIIKRINGAIASDVQEVKHGEWIYHSETYNTKSGFTCSVCKDPMWHSPDVKQAFKYCPHCGAKMDGGTNKC